MNANLRYRQAVLRAAKAELDAATRREYLSKQAGSPPPKPASSPRSAVHEGPRTTTLYDHDNDQDVPAAPKGSSPGVLRP
jgi:hypothetical protein